MNSNGDILNILFLGGAKRVSFGRKLIAAAESRGIKLRIFSYELDPRVPIALIGDVIIGKKWNDEHVLEDLHKVVAEFNMLTVPWVSLHPTYQNMVMCGVLWFVRKWRRRFSIK